MRYQVSTANNIKRALVLYGHIAFHFFSTKVYF